MRLFVLVFAAWLWGGCTPAQEETAGPGWDNERPAWTPDGQSIIFNSNRRGNWDLFIMNADGTNQHALTETPHHELFPAVSPDGNRVAYVGAVDRNYDIYVLHRTQGTVERLTTAAAIDDWPSWIDDGQRILFDSERTGRWGIYVMQADGSGQQVVIDTEAKEIDPTATLTGTTFIFSRQEGEARQLYQFDRTTGTEQQLTQAALTHAHPALSPDGRTVAFNAGGDHWQVYRLDLETGVQTQLTQGTAYDNKWPAWSPDGQRLAFMSNREGRWEIYTMTPDGKAVQRLTFGSEARP